MATRLADAFGRHEMRFEPTPKWIRGELGGATVVDSRDAWLVWDPGRMVPGWCFPRAHVHADVLVPAGGERSALVSEVFDVGDVGQAAWVYADPDMQGRLAIEFRALDRWLEEDEEAVGHPRDPFKRIDVLRSSRHVRIAVGDAVVADSTRPLLLFETGLPVRYYLPPEDVRMDLLTRSGGRTLCAYKGEASYYSVGGEDDVAWFYPEPLRDHAVIRGRIAFFNERVDLEVDGERLERPPSPWA